MATNNKIVAVMTVALIILSSCLIFFTVNENIPEDSTRYPVDLHDGMSQTFLNTYKGVDYKYLDKINDRYWEGEMTVEGGCTASFANYYGENVGVVRNMDLYQTENGVYDIVVYPDGKTVKYTTVGISYSSTGDPYTADEVRKNGMSKERYEMIPFLTQDCMSYGGKYSDGACKCLYTSTLIREAQYTDDFSEIIWRTAGTYPDAAITSTTVSLNAVIAYNCCTVEEALKFTGATLYDETKDPKDYKVIYPDSTPGVNIYSMWKGSYNWNIVTTLIDGEGNCGFLEVIDGHVIYIPCHNVSAVPSSMYSYKGFKWEYSVSANFYLDKHYLLNSETSDVSGLSILPKEGETYQPNKYKEQYSFGLGRYEAIVSYIEGINTQSEHIKLMDTVNYSYYSYRDYSQNYVGWQYTTGIEMPTKAVNWTAELSGVDFFSEMSNYEEAGVNIKQANDRYAAAHKTAEDPYPVLKLTYYDSYPEEGQAQLRKISYEEWKASPGRYVCLVDTNWVMNPDEDVQAELNSKLEWLGYISNHCDMDDIMNMAIWCTAFRSVATPYDGNITFWYFENERYRDSFNIVDIAEKGPMSSSDLVKLVHEYTEIWSRGGVSTAKT